MFLFFLKNLRTKSFKTHQNSWDSCPCVSDKSLSPWHGKTVRNPAKRFADQVTVGEDQRSIFVALKLGSRGGGRLWGAWYKLPVQLAGWAGWIGAKFRYHSYPICNFCWSVFGCGIASRCGQTQSCKTPKTFGRETKQDNPQSPFKKMWSPFAAISCHMPSAVCSRVLQVSWISPLHPHFILSSLRSPWPLGWSQHLGLESPAGDLQPEPPGGNPIFSSKKHTRDAKLRSVKSLGQNPGPTGRDS